MGDDKVKLSFDGQISDMKDKGISFDICSENDAKKFLMNNTYYFKIKAYEKIIMICYVCQIINI